MSCGEKEKGSGENAPFVGDKNTYSSEDLEYLCKSVLPSCWTVHTARGRVIIFQLGKFGHSVTMNLGVLTGFEIRRGSGFDGCLQVHAESRLPVFDCFASTRAYVFGTTISRVPAACVAVSICCSLTTSAPL